MQKIDKRLALMLLVTAVLPMLFFIIFAIISEKRITAKLDKAIEDRSTLLLKNVIKELKINLENSTTNNQSRSTPEHFEQPAKGINYVGYDNVATAGDRFYIENSAFSLGDWVHPHGRAIYFDNNTILFRNYEGELTLVTRNVVINTRELEEAGKTKEKSKTAETT